MKRSPNFSERAQEPELMDLPYEDPMEIRLAIREIETINRLLDGFNQSLRDIQGFIQVGEKLEIQDWGCGSGDLLRILEKWGNRNAFQLDLSGYDIDPEIIAYAQENSQNSKIQYFCKNVLSPEILPNSTDIVSSCLFTHHFDNSEWVLLIKKMFSVARKGVVINDLHRHPLAYYSIKILTRLFSHSNMVKYDAPLSVAKGFNRDELKSLLKTAGIENYRIRWNWAFRWSIILYKNE